VNARSLPDPNDFLPDPERELPPVRQLMFDWFETGIRLGIVPENADRADPKASAWRKRVHALRTTGRLPAVNYGREWRWSVVELRKFVGLDTDASSSRRAAS
jgi:hypothetical protein